MKDATGGALLLGLATAILLVFIIFACFFINFGVTFKAKNSVINYIEQHEGGTKNEIVEYINDNVKGYKFKSSTDKICYQYVCRGTKIEGIIYKISLHMIFEKTVIGGTDKFNFSIPITGETKMISTGKCFENFTYMNNYCINGVEKCNNTSSSCYILN